MSQRHALLVAPYFPPAVGGVERYVENVARQLISRGWRVSVVTSGHHRRGVTRSVESGVAVHRLPVRARVSNTPVGFGWRKALRHVIDSERPDVINAHAPVPVMADIAAAVAGDVPLVLTYHTGPMRKGRPAVDAALRGYEATVLSRSARRADQVICSSSYVQASFPDLFFAKATVIAPGADVERFVASPVTSANQLLFVGSLAKATSYKGLADALRSLAELRGRGVDATLRVVGEGDGREDYERLAKQLGLSDIADFSGGLDGDQLTAAYRDCRALVLPTRFDSFPTVLVEAMASGRPVISTNVGGIPSLVEDGVSGLLVSPRDSSALTAALQRVLDPGYDATGAGAAGRARVTRDLTWSRQGKRTEAVFERAIAARSPGRPLRVATVAPYFAPHVGGVERYSQTLSRFVDGLPGADAVVVTTGSNRRGIQHETVDGLPTVRLPAWLTVSNTPVNPLWLWQLRRLFKQLDVDVVHAHSPVPGLADLAMLAGRGRRRILTYHSGSMVKGTGHFDGLVRAYERFVLPKVFGAADLLTVASPTCLGAGRPGTVQLPPGVDTRQFAPVLAASATQPVVLYVGRLEQASNWKGVDVLLRAFADVASLVPEASLWLVGGGDAVGTHQRSAEVLGIRDRVRFLGPLDTAALTNAYTQARVVVLPSLTESESFGMSLVEAMACGRPVIGSRVGGIPHVITDGVDGRLVPPGDERALATAMTRLLLDDAGAAAMGRQARRSAVERFDWARTLTAYRQVLGIDALTSAGCDCSSPEAPVSSAPTSFAR